MAVDALSNQKLNRLKEALVAAGVVRGERDKTVAAVTGYAEGSIRSLLSGGTPLTGNFIKAVCIKFNIRWKWIKDGEEPMLARQGEAPYPDLIQKDDSVDTGSGIADHQKAFSDGISNSDLPERILQGGAGISLGVSGKLTTHQVRAQPIAGGSSALGITGPAIAGFPATPRVITEKIEQYYALIGEAELGRYMALALWEISALTKQEVIDLIFQVRKIVEGNSDKLATLAADEKFQLLGIKPTTRLKLERIPVVDDDEKQEK